MHVSEFKYSLLSLWKSSLHMKLCMLNLTKCMDFIQFLTGTYGESNTNNHLHTEFVQTKFNMGNLYLDNHHQFFWQLTDHLIQCFLA